MSPDDRLAHQRVPPVEAVVPPVEPEDDAIASAVDDLIPGADVPRADVRQVRELVATGIRLGQDRTDRLDLKIAAAALTEMRAAFRIFAPYNDIPKVTIFGSARTQATDPGYVQAHDVAAALADDGWMVVTGAGPGIMQAAMEGAGADRSIGVSIRLPFETSANAVIAGDAKLVSMKYFFTRKLMLVKESKAFVSVPGGFGTLDETFELLTLQQTGKAEPTPIVLLDHAVGTYWHGFSRFVTEEVVPRGLVAADDLERVLVTDSVDEAVAEINGFWRNYDSLRWVGDRLVLRLRCEPTDAEVSELNERFRQYLAKGSITKSGPIGPERSEGDQLDLPRLVMVWDQYRIGELHQIVRAINALESAHGSASTNWGG
ncbi:MAG: TIGR00730 family Rossman fold protein [Acidimicrobiales bacterium]